MLAEYHPVTRRYRGGRQPVGPREHRHALVFQAREPSVRRHDPETAFPILMKRGNAAFGRQAIHPAVAVEIGAAQPCDLTSREPDPDTAAA
jgi:hypothetical protein